MSRPFLIDVSRLVWRIWSRRLPTGIDRVCLAYLDHFGERAQAVVQRGGQFRVFSPSASRRLFGALEGGPAGGRRRLATAMAHGLLTARHAPERHGLFYLNVGHTGLDEVSLPAWVADHRLRAIYLVHDLIPLTHPLYCRAGETGRHQRRMTNVLESATGVIGNSRATLSSFAELAAERGTVMPPSIAAWIGGPPKRVSAPARAPLTTPYFITVGTIEGRKNHVLLLEIWRNLVIKYGAEAPTLMVVGQRGWQAGSALSLLDQADQYCGKVIELNHCADEQLASWIANARALLMPSFAEGFGLPIVEALQLGTPVIASDLAIFREIAPGIPTLVSPDDPSSWARWIIAFIGNDPERGRQVDRITDYRAPDWGQHFAIVDEWLARL